MTTYTNIPDGDIDQDSPVTQPLMTALRDNPIAITEGASGAPRINPIDAMSHNGAVGAVGTYAFLRFVSSSSANPGTTHSGVDLVWSNAQGDDRGGVNFGTWRVMGSAFFTSNMSSATVFLRIL